MSRPQIKAQQARRRLLQPRKQGEPLSLSGFKWAATQSGFPGQPDVEGWLRWTVPQLKQIAKDHGYTYTQGET